MSYNGIGLSSARGSGTNGYVQRNLSTVEEESTIKKPNQELLIHDRKRAIELEIIIEQEKLEEKGKLTEEETEEMLTVLRAELTAKLNDSHFGYKDPKNLSEFDTHQIAHANAEKNKTFANAMRIKDNFVEGQAFDRDFQEQKKIERIAQRGKRDQEYAERQEQKAKERKEYLKAEEAREKQREKDDRRRKEEQESERAKKEEMKAVKESSASPRGKESSAAAEKLQMEKEERRERRESLSRREVRQRRRDSLPRREERRRESSSRRDDRKRRRSPSNSSSSSSSESSGSSSGDDRRRR
jgi:serine/arginine repetitive matrix protein 2